MGVPRLAKHSAAVVAADAVGTTQIENDAVTQAKIHDDAVGADQVVSGDDFIMGTVEATKVTATSGVVTKYAHHTGVALADLTAAFGNPAALDNNILYLYKNDTDAKIYVVAVVGSVFQIAELTHVTA